MKTGNVPHLSLVVDNTRGKVSPEKDPAREILELLRSIYGETDLLSLKKKSDTIAAGETNGNYLNFAQLHKPDFDFLFDSLQNPETLDNDLRLINFFMLLVYERYMALKKNHQADGAPKRETPVPDHSAINKELDVWITKTVSDLYFSPRTVKKAFPAASAQLREAINDNIKNLLKGP